MQFSRRRLIELAPAAFVYLAWSCRSSADPTSARPESADVAEFLAAVQRGDVAAVRAALERAAHLAAATDAQGRSAFVLAHLAGQPSVAQVLLDQGIELDVVEAVLARDWKRVESLAAAAPAAMNAAHPIGGTPLYAGALVGADELYRLRSLHCDPDARPAGGSGFTPARAAMDCADPVGAFLSATDLLGNRSDVNAPQAGGDSVLHGAVRSKDERLVRLVLRKDGDVQARDARGRTPRALAEELGWSAGATLLENHAAIQRDHRASRFAFDANREPVTVPDLSDVPIDLQSEVTGASHARLEVVRSRVSEDPRLVFSISTDGELAIEACGHTGNREIIRYHLDNGAPLSLPTAVSLGDADHVRFLLDHDPRLVYERGPHDFAPMWYPAIGGGSVELAELLLSRGAPVDQESLGTTGLHWAVRRNALDLVAFLLERGANIDAVGYKFDRAGQTPLELARAQGRDEIVRLLVESGAS